jgi:hypothetical protein
LTAFKHVFNLLEVTPTQSNIIFKEFKLMFDTSPNNEESVKQHYNLRDDTGAKATQLNLDSGSNVTFISKHKPGHRKQR